MAKAETSLFIDYLSDDDAEIALNVIGRIEIKDEVFRLISVEGTELAACNLYEVKKISFVKNSTETNLVDNTNIEAVFELLLNTAIQNNCSQEEIPQNVVIISDMEFDAAAHSPGGGYTWYRNAAPTPAYSLNRNNVETVMEGVARKWAQHGYKMPHIVYWNCDARSDNIPMLGNGPISYVSGFSPSIFQTILTGKTGFDLMMDALNNVRYSVIH